ncbi:IS1 family transposase [Methanosarcina mazei]|nr:hypothetical protein DU40_20145 [Methanosarcina mazei]
MFGADSDSYIGTSYAERINLTIRTSLARFIRKGMNFSKTKRMHQKAIPTFGRSTLEIRTFFMMPF